MTLFQYVEHAWRAKYGPVVHWVSEIDLFNCCFKTACDRVVTTNNPDDPEFMERDMRPWRITCKVCYKAKRRSMAR